MSNHVVITGGMGFIFSHVTEHFLTLGWEVTVIDNMSTGSHPELIDVFSTYSTFHLIRMDVSDVNVINTIVTLNPAYIIHAAAYSDVDVSIKEPTQIVQKNFLGNLHIFEAARYCTNLKKLLYINTDEIFGECRTQKKEDELMFPRNPYSASKATGALIRYAYDNSFPELKDKTTETRFCNVFGPRQDARKIIPRIIKALKTGDPLPVHNGGFGKREYIYVKNIPPLLEKILLTGKRTYNITNNDLYSVNDIIEKIEKMTGKVVPKCRGSRPGMDTIYQMDSMRARLEFHWKPEWSFEEGLLSLLTEEGLI